MICVECKNNVSIADKKKLHCVKCVKKVDKYYQTCQTLQHIDCLLLKSEIFIHYLVNDPISRLRLFSACILQLFCMFTVHFTYITNTNIKLVPPYYLLFDIRFQLLYASTYLSIICILFNDIGIKRILFLLTFSSYFNSFKILFALWRYDRLLPYFILEILNLCSNVAALKCFYSDHKKTFIYILMSKIFSFMIAVMLLSGIRLGI
jgi:hypothetical protein